MLSIASISRVEEIDIPFLENFISWHTDKQYNNIGIDKMYFFIGSKDHSKQYIF